jgi:hypothetical protein
VNARVLRVRGSEPGENSEQIHHKTTEIPKSSLLKSQAYHSVNPHTLLNQGTRNPPDGIVRHTGRTKDAEESPHHRKRPSRPCSRPSRAGSKNAPHPRTASGRPSREDRNELAGVNRHKLSQCQRSAIHPGMERRHKKSNNPLTLIGRQFHWSGI